ncbi:MAG: aminoglycoside 6-adenylyltransferase [Bacilli bacterium]|nr:aminoglycoside 6-adenylyltransferase [Bacilli bacterium]
MRDLNRELQRILQFAKENDNIRALVLQGSFVNDNVLKDDFSDLDPLFYVRDTSQFITKNDWKQYFGKPMSEFSDEGVVRDGLKWYTRLTIFDDGFKIDFGFQSVELAKYANDMQLYRIYLDKDDILPKPEVTDERKFYVIRPTEEQFLARINAFFYDSSYVVKALARNEMYFVKYMESVIRDDKIKILLDWYIGLDYDFKVNTGIMGRYFRRYLDDEIWNMMLRTYSNGERTKSAEGLMAMFDLVHKLGIKIAEKLDFEYPQRHEKDMRAYCTDIIKRYL